MIAVWPFIFAHFKAVLPFLLRAFIFAPFANNIFTIAIAFGIGL